MTRQISYVSSPIDTDRIANYIIDSDNVLSGENQKYEAKRLKRNGYPDGTPVGAPAIAKILKNKYGRNALSERTISRLIAGVRFRLLEEPYVPADVPGSLRSYIGRLSLVKQSLMGGQTLNVLEARLTDRILHEFADPQGERVDLIAQFAVLWELAEREVTGYPIQDLEDLFNFAPWTDESELYKVAIQTGAAEPPKLSLLMPMIFDDDHALVRMLVGAFAQLNLPFLYHAFDVTDRTIAYVWREHEGIHSMQSAVGDERRVEILRKECNWRVKVRDYLRGFPYVTG